MLALSGSAIEQVENEDQGYAMPDVPVDPFLCEEYIVQPVNKMGEQAVLDKST